MMDQYYTPPGLAALLVSASKVRKAKLVADFAMGDGALLRAAEARWPKTRLFGSDINPAAADAAHGLIGQLTFSPLDFLDDHQEYPELKGLTQCCDVILLNPPFSCRGNRRYPVKVGGEALYGSKALVFVCRALNYLKPQGEALAILPASCTTSERDRSLITALRIHYTVDQIGEINRNAFAGCTVSVIIVRIKRRSFFQPRQVAMTTQTPVPLKTFQARIMRGGTSIHETSPVEQGSAVLHTSDLKMLNLSPQRWIARSNQIQGAAVLLPRVGRPDKLKLVAAELPPIVLSDCVIAIQTEPPGFEGELLRLMRTRWPDLEKLYSGSCAPYVTLGQLQRFLLQSGVVCTRGPRQTSSAVNEEAVSVEIRPAVERLATRG